MTLTLLLPLVLLLMFVAVLGLLQLFGALSRTFGWGTFLALTAALLIGVVTACCLVVAIRTGPPGPALAMAELIGTGQTDASRPVGPEPLAPRALLYPASDDLDRSHEGSTANLPSQVTVRVFNRAAPAGHQDSVRDEKQSLETLPDWVSQPAPPTRDGDRVVMLLSSLRYATQAEAEQQLLGSLIPDLTPELLARYPGLAGAHVGHPLSVDLLRSSGILRRECVATYPVQVGEFTPEVMQVHWDIELGPEQLSRLYAAWRPTLIGSRLATLGVAIAILSLFWGLLALVLRQPSIAGT